MSKFFRNFLIFVFIPLAYVVLAANLTPSLDLDTLNIFRVTALLIAFLGSIFIIFKNAQNKTNKVIWYVLPGLTLIISGFLAFAIISLSNFGF